MDSELETLNKGLPPGWEALRDEESKSIYYFHRVLEVKTSDRPQIHKKKTPENSDKQPENDLENSSTWNNLIHEIDEVLENIEGANMKRSSSKSRSRSGSRSRSMTQVSEHKLSISMDGVPSMVKYTNGEVERGANEKKADRMSLTSSASAATWGNGSVSEPTSPSNPRIKHLEHSSETSDIIIGNRSHATDGEKRDFLHSSVGGNSITSIGDEKKKIQKSGGGMLSKFLFKKKEEQMNADESVAFHSHLKHQNSDWEKDRTEEAEKWMNIKENIREKKWDPNPIPSELDAKTASVIDWGCTTHGFNLEFGRETEKEELQLEEISKHTNFYQTLFADKEHYNFVGQDDILGPIVISIEGIPSAGDNKNLRVLFRTKKGDERLAIPRPFNGNFPDNPDNLMKTLKAMTPSLQGIKFCRISDAKQHSDLVERLLSYERQLIQKGYKFGVLYVADGQKDENEMFNNVKDSAGFREFLDLVSDKVSLKGFGQFAGGLDTKTDSTGTQSYHTVHRGVQIMMHVSTLLPYFPKDLQQVERKRHLGNDVVMLVYKDGDTAPFDPRVIASQFNHVFCVVQPEDGGYRIQFANKFGVKPYSPAIPKPPLFPKDRSLRDFLLTKLVNGERAAMYAPDFRGTLARTREVLLKSMVTTFWAPSPKGLRKNFSFMGTKKRSNTLQQPNRGSMADNG